MPDDFSITGPYKYPHDAHPSYSVFGPSEIIASFYVHDGDLESAVDRAQMLVDALRAQQKK